MNFDDFITSTNEDPQDFYTAAMLHESGGKNIPNAAGGKAFGYFQFMPGTWGGLRQSHPELGLPEDIKTATREQQLAAYRAFAQGNAKVLDGAGIPINDKNVFMASFLGSGGATKFLQQLAQNPNASADKLFPTEAASNPTIFNGKTLSQVYAQMTNKFGSGNTTGYGNPEGSTALDKFLQSTEGGYSETPPAAPPAMTPQERQREINAQVLKEIYPGSLAGRTNWGAGEEAGNSALFGYGAQFRGAGRALGVYGATGDPEAAKQAYTQEVLASTLARHNYEAGNPWTATGAQMVGSIPPTILALSGLGAGLGAAAEAGGPVIGAAARFLGGTTGAGIENPLLRGAASTASRAASGAVQGLTADYATSSPGEEHPIADLTLGPLGNVVLGGMGAKLANAGINPDVADAARNYMTQVKASLGEEPLLWGGQITSDKGLQSVGGRVVSNEMKQKQLDQYTRAVAATFGGLGDITQAGTNGLTRAALDESARRIGALFDDIAAHTVIPGIGNPDLMNGLSAIRQSAANILNPSKEAEVNRAIDLVERGMAKNGWTIPGSLYQELTNTRKGGIVKQLMSDPATEDAGRQLKQLLDDQLEQHAPQAYQGAMGAARQQYKNYMLAEAALKNTESGVIDPKKYAAAMTKSPYGPFTKQVQDIAIAGSKGNVDFPVPAAAGTAAGTPSGDFLAKHPVGVSAGLGTLGGALGGQVAEHALPMLAHFSGAPMLESPSLLALLGGGATAAAAAGRHLAHNAALKSPAWVQALTGGYRPALDVGVGAAPLAVQLANLPWGQNEKISR